MINPSLLTSDKPLKAKLGKIGGNFAKIIFSDGQTIEISAKFIPQNSKEGDILYLNLLCEDELEIAREDVGKKVLEEILNSQ